MTSTSTPAAGDEDMEERVRNLRSRFPQYSEQAVESALVANGGHAGKAVRALKEQDKQREHGLSGGVVEVAEVELATASVEISTPQENWFGGIREKTRKSLRRSIKRHVDDRNSGDSIPLLGLIGMLIPPTCCAVGMFCLLFIPGVTINNYQQSLARGVAAEFGEDGGLSSYTTPVTVAAVYHTNTVARQLVHEHHPHSPQVGKSARRRMQVLREAQPVREVFDFPVRKPVHALHPHITPAPVMVMRGKLAFEDGSAYEGEYVETEVDAMDGDDTAMTTTSRRPIRAHGADEFIAMTTAAATTTATPPPTATTWLFHGEGTFTHADGLVMSGRFEGGEYVCEACGAPARPLARPQPLHWTDTCYDRLRWHSHPVRGTAMPSRWRPSPK